MPEIWNPQPIEVLKDWVDTIIQEASDELNDWESKFVDDMLIRIYSGKQLTENQQNKLEQIYTEKTK